MANHRWNINRRQRFYRYQLIIHFNIAFSLKNNVNFGSFFVIMGFGILFYINDMDTCDCIRDVEKRPTGFTARAFLRVQIVQLNYEPVQVFLHLSP